MTTTMDWPDRVTRSARTDMESPYSSGIVFRLPPYLRDLFHDRRDAHGRSGKPERAVNCKNTCPLPAPVAAAARDIETTVSRVRHGCCTPTETRAAVIGLLLRWLDISRDEAERLIDEMHTLRREHPEQPVKLHRLSQGTGLLITDLHVAMNIFARVGMVSCRSLITHRTCKTVLLGPRDCCEMAICELLENGPVRCPVCRTLIAAETQCGVEVVFNHNGG